MAVGASAMTGYQLFMMIVQVVALVFMFVNLVYVSQQQNSSLQSPLIVLMFSTIIMFIGYIIEIEGENLETSMVGVAIAYVGKPYVMLASFRFICAFYQRKIPKPLYYSLAIFSSLFFWVVYTNKYHYLYYASVAYERASEFSPLILTHGPLYYTYVVSAVIYFVACLYEVYKGYRHSGGAQKNRHAAYILGMVVFGIAGYAVYLSGITGGYDSTMLGVFFGVVCLSMLFFRCRIFDVLTLAKEQALEDSSTGLLVLDAGDNEVYKNKAVKTLLYRDLSVEQLKRIQGHSANLNVNGRIYAVTRKDLFDKDEYVGRSIEIADITDSFNYQARLEREVRERADRIESIQRSIIMSIANIVEARSMETGEHTRRTMELVRQIAEELRREGKHTDVLTDRYIDMLSSAASMHDIGKISVPDAILLKPGKLTDEEFEQIKTHTTAGAMVVEKVMNGLESPDYVEMCKDVAHYHHEKWNGKGYPCGLIGEEIPLSARIMALADVFDAVTSKRCYKETISREEAFNMVREESGKHFDPEVVEAFMRVMGQELL